MRFIFDDFTESTEALVTAVNVLNQDLGQYVITVLGLDKDRECGYTNKGTVTIDDDELKSVLESKALPFPAGIIGQKVKLISKNEMQKEQEHNSSLNKLLNSGEELETD